MVKKKARRPFQLNTFTEKLTASIGTPFSIVLHTVFFVGIFVLQLFGVSFEQIMLILTTVVSLEAIYLSIFIQMTVNKNTESLAAVEDDIETIQENVDEIQEDVDEIQQDVAEVEADTDIIQKNVQGIGDEVEEISEDLDQIQSEEDNDNNKKTMQTLLTIESHLNLFAKDLKELRNDIDILKNKIK